MLQQNKIWQTDSFAKRSETLISDFVPHFNLQLSIKASNG